MKKYLLALCYFLLLCFSASSQTKKAQTAAMPDSGKTMHFVSMTDINGNKILPADLTGKAIVGIILTLLRIVSF